LTFLNGCISVKTSLINTKLVDFVKENEDNFATFYLDLEFLNEAEKEKNN